MQGHAVQAPRQNNCNRSFHQVYWFRAIQASLGMLELPLFDLRGQIKFSNDWEQIQMSRVQRLVESESSQSEEGQ